jgi:hypothetical protein
MKNTKKLQFLFGRLFGDLFLDLKISVFKLVV